MNGNRFAPTREQILLQKEKFIEFTFIFHISININTTLGHDEIT